ncbi:hypothetical protein Cgig2_018776 [Carnegiea gigantea]|uniref:Uncharacterized protein n=1 Tax=Carnegiea gigantea TaxID=171969 RepID=A0A9Q1GU55_9CARY|nr:hypothetical protein Cgig2_018776 [Carnegiea gigantea]
MWVCQKKARRGTDFGCESEVAFYRFYELLRLIPALVDFMMRLDLTTKHKCAITPCAAVGSLFLWSFRCIKCLPSSRRLHHPVTSSSSFVMEMVLDIPFKGLELMDNILAGVDGQHFGCEKGQFMQTLNLVPNEAQFFGKNETSSPHFTAFSVLM